MSESTTIRVSNSVFIGSCLLMIAKAIAATGTSDPATNCQKVVTEVEKTIELLRKADEEMNK